TGGDIARAGRLGAAHKYSNRIAACAAAICAAVLLVLLAASGLPNAQAASGASNAIDVALVLAIDASGSVDDDRFELQKHGFAAAFRNPKILNAIRAGDHRAIAIFMLQWTGPTQQEVMVPWSYVSDEISAERVAVAIEAAPRHLM